MTASFRLTSLTVCWSVSAWLAFLPACSTPPSPVSAAREATPQERERVDAAYRSYRQALESKNMVLALTQGRYAVQQARTLLGTGARQTATIELDLAGVLMTKESLDEAFSLYQPAIRTLASLDGETSPALFVPYRDTSRIQTRKLKYADAHATYAKAIATLERVEPRDPQALAELLTEAAANDESDARFAEAGTLLERAATLRKARADVDPKGAAEALEHAGHNAFLLKSMERAAQLYEESAALLTGAGLQSDPLWTQVQRELVATYEALGNRTKVTELVKMVPDAEVVPLVQVSPKYPFWAKRRSIQGTVLVEVTIAEDGSVEDARVVEARPRDTFDAAALEAARQWKFAPKIVDGSPVRQRGTIELSFGLVAPLIDTD